MPLLNKEVINIIKVLGSSSSGNSYIYEVDNEILLIELGLNFKTIKQGLNFDLSKVKAAIVTHSHGDHSKGVKEALNSGVDVYMSNGTIEELELDNHRLHGFEYDGEYPKYKMFKVGNFTIFPFQSQHDTKEPVNFLIHHPKDGKTLFITDSYYCKHRFNKVDRLLVECNYSEEVLPTLPPWRFRTLKSHMSLETLKETLSCWNLTNTKDITLIHISHDNGEPERFRQEIKELTGIKTYIGESGLVIE